MKNLELYHLISWCGSLGLQLVSVELNEKKNKGELILKNDRAGYWHNFDINEL